VPFVAAVSLNDQGRPMYLEHSLVSGFTLNAIGKWAQAHLTPGTVVTSDGLACFAAVTDAKCVHVPMVVGDLQPRDLPEFKSVNTVLGNLKTTLAGTFHALKYRKYADHYLAAFAYRFNRHGPIVDVARCTPAKELIVRAHAEAGYSSGAEMPPFYDCCSPPAGSQARMRRGLTGSRGMVTVLKSSSSRRQEN
jgi:hypothetical protein